MNRSNPLYRQLARNRSQNSPGSDPYCWESAEYSYDWEANPENRWIPPLTLGNQDTHPLSASRFQSDHEVETDSVSAASLGEENAVMTPARRAEAYREANARYKSLTERMRQLQGEEDALLGSLRVDFDPPEVRVENQWRLRHIRDEQRALRQQIDQAKKERSQSRNFVETTLAGIGALVFLVLCFFGVAG